MTSIKTHPYYPFVRIGLAFDLYPELAVSPAEHVVLPTDWTIDLDDEGLDGATYYSEAAALEAVEAYLFDGYHNELLERQIGTARECRDWSLALRLVDGRARAEGYRRAQDDWAAKLGPLREQFREFFRSSGRGVR